MAGHDNREEEVTRSSSIRPGDVVAGKYQIVSVLGVGGMGIVFLARHLELDGLVAIKFLSEAYATNSEAVRRFRREAQAAVKLKSPHVVRVFDVGLHTNAVPYIVMEHLEGGDLAKMIETSGPLPPTLAAELLVQTCEALFEAHGKGVIHRDSKPANLFCIPRPNGEMTIKVVDFGISKVMGAMSTTSGLGVTTAGQAIGSPSYMSPEQMKADYSVDHRTEFGLWGSSCTRRSPGISLFRRVRMPRFVYGRIKTCPSRRARCGPASPLGSTQSSTSAWRRTATTGSSMRPTSPSLYASSRAQSGTHSSAPPPVNPEHREPTGSTRTAAVALTEGNWSAPPDSSARRRSARVLAFDARLGGSGPRCGRHCLRCEIAEPGGAYDRV